MCALGLAQHTIPCLLDTEFWTDGLGVRRVSLDALPSEMDGATAEGEESSTKGVRYPECLKWPRPERKAELGQMEGNRLINAMEEWIVSKHSGLQ